MHKHQITIYTLPSCEICHMAKAYLNSRNLAFKEVNVDSDPNNQKEMITKSGQYAVPVIDLGGKIMVGFQKDTLEALL